MSVLGTYILCGVGFSVFSLSLGIVSPGDGKHHPILTPLMLVALWPIFATLLILALLRRH